MKYNNRKGQKNIQKFSFVDDDTLKTTETCVNKRLWRRTWSHVHVHKVYVRRLLDCMCVCVCVWLLVMCCVSIAASIFLYAARINLPPVVSKTQRRCLEVPVGVSGVMGVQVSLVPVRRTSWLFFPSLKIPRSTTLSLPRAKHAGNMLHHTGLEHWLWCSRQIDFHFGKVKVKPIVIEYERFLSLDRADCWNVMVPLRAS